MGILKILLGTANGWLAAAIAGFVAFAAYTQSVKSTAETKTIQKIEKASRNAASKGKRAATKSRAGSVRGIPDPITRN